MLKPGLARESLGRPRPDDPMIRRQHASRIWPKEELILALAVLLFVGIVLGLVGRAAYDAQYADCDTFAAVALKNVPARCVAYFGGRP